MRFLPNGKSTTSTRCLAHQEAGPRRGPKTKAEYAQVIGAHLMASASALDQCELLTNTPLVDYLLQRFPQRFILRGAAVRFALDTAIQRVIAQFATSSCATDRRIATYLTARCAGKRVKDIACELHVSREYITRITGRQARDFVADVFLALNRDARCLPNQREE